LKKGLSVLSGPLQLREI